MGLDYAVAVLETGFVGFAFLLAYLAYKLILEIIQGRKPSTGRILLVICFMFFELILAVVTSWLSGQQAAVM